MTGIPGKTGVVDTLAFRRWKLGGRWACAASPETRARPQARCVRARRAACRQARTSPRGSPRCGSRTGGAGRRVHPDEPPRGRAPPVRVPARCAYARSRSAGGGRWSAGSRASASESMPLPAKTTGAGSPNQEPQQRDRRDPELTAGGDRRVPRAGEPRDPAEEAGQRWHHSPCRIRRLDEDGAGEIADQLRRTHRSDDLDDRHPGAGLTLDRFPAHPLERLWEQKGGLQDLPARATAAVHIGRTCPAHHRASSLEPNG